METGTYKKRAIDFSKYTVSKPNLTFYSGFKYQLWGCGATVGSLLTGIHPKEVAKYNKHSSHFSDEMMIKFLRKHKFKLIPLTIASISNSKIIENKLDENHLIIISQMLKRNEASWAVLLNCQYHVHNFEINRLTTTEFIERPILTAYVAYKPEWR